MSSKKLSIFREIKNFLSKKRKEIEQKHAQRLLEEKSNAIAYINRPLTDGEIESINLDIAINSDFWIGGDWTEKDIKLRYLKNCRELFNDDEYQYYYQQIINQNKKTKC